MKHSKCSAEPKRHKKVPVKREIVPKRHKGIFHLQKYYCGNKNRTKQVHTAAGGMSYDVTSRELVRQVPLVRGHP